MRDDLREELHNTTGAPDLGFPALGVAGAGHWTMQIVVDHTWRALLTDAPVHSGGAYPLAAVPSVPLAAPSNTHLTMTIIGYVEHDRSGGVNLASASPTGAASLTWDAGPLAGLCCGTPQTYVPPHGA